MSQSQCGRSHLSGRLWIVALVGRYPRQPANPTRAHPVPPQFFTPDHAVLCAYAVLAVISNCYPPVQGRLPTRYSPVRHSVKGKLQPKSPFPSASFDLHVLSTTASVHPEPGSNSLIKCLMLRITFGYPVLHYCFWFVQNRSLNVKNFQVYVFYCSVIKVRFFAVLS